MWQPSRESNSPTLLRSYPILLGYVNNQIAIRSLLHSETRTLSHLSTDLLFTAFFVLACYVRLIFLIATCALPSYFGAMGRALLYSLYVFVFLLLTFRLTLLLSFLS